MKTISAIFFAALMLATTTGGQNTKIVPTKFGEVAIGETFEQWADINKLSFAPDMCRAAVNAAVGDDKKGWSFLMDQFKSIGRVSTSASGLFTVGTVIGDFSRCKDFVSGSDFDIPIRDSGGDWNGKIVFQDGKVDEIDLTFEDALSDVLSLMQKKYGRPTVMNHDLYENGFGATFQKPTAAWQMQDGTSIVASGTAPFDTSQLTFVLYLSKMAQKRMTEAKKAEPNPF